ncbi:hypothetical protein ABZ342_15275 [Amycolatopsis sp. NPDC005961]|uniref:DUF7340 domain-containing protein n=1 Tax=Amycolatopsis sp. NPDC005961 TaxID=3156720 RepID=UPI00340E734C
MLLLDDLRDRVRKAVADLVEPVTVTLPRDDGSWVKGVNVSLIDQLTEAVATGLERGGGRRSGGPGLPICVAAVDLYAEAFDDFRAPGFTLKQSIEAIPATLAGIEDIAVLTRGLRMLQKLEASIERLFAPVKKVPLHGAICPMCDADSIVRDDELGEKVRMPALVADTVNGAECRNCKQSWSAENLEILAQLLTLGKE